MAHAVAVSLGLGDATGLARFPVTRRRSDAGDDGWDQPWFSNLGRGRDDNEPGGRDGWGSDGGDAGDGVAVTEATAAVGETAAGAAGATDPDARSLPREAGSSRGGLSSPRPRPRRPGRWWPAPVPCGRGPTCSGR